MRHPCLREAIVTVLDSTGRPYAEMSNDCAQITRFDDGRDINAVCSLAMEPKTYFAILVDIARDCSRWLSYDALRVTVMIDGYKVATDYLFHGHETVVFEYEQDPRWPGYGRGLRVREARVSDVDCQPIGGIKARDLGTIEVWLDEVDFVSGRRISLLGPKKKEALKREVTTSTREEDLDWSAVHFDRRLVGKEQNNICTDLGVPKLYHPIRMSYDAIRRSKRQWAYVFDIGHNAFLAQRRAIELRYFAELATPACCTSSVKLEDRSEDEAKYEPRIKQEEEP